MPWSLNVEWTLLEVRKLQICPYFFVEYSKRLSESLIVLWEQNGATSTSASACPWLLLLLLLLSCFSHVWFCATPWTAAHQAPLSMGVSRQEYWSGVPLPSPMSLTSWSQPCVWFLFFFPWILRDKSVAQGLSDSGFRFLSLISLFGYAF